MNLNEAYTKFFLKSPEGQEFVKTVEGIIARAHELAEKNPDSARDASQRAVGAREVLNHIISTTTKAKKGKT